MACGRDAEARGGVAVDGHVQLQARGLLVGGHVAQLGQLLQPARARLRRPVVAARRGWRPRSVYWYCVRGSAAADAHVLHGLQEEVDAGDLRRAWGAAGR